MSDFDDAFGTADTSSDPAADFLNAEQMKMQQLNLDDDQFEGSPMENGMLDADLSEDNLVNGHTNDIDVEPTGTTDNDFYAAISEQDRSAQEPQKLREWREQQTARLAEKDADEKIAIEEWAELAAAELSDWYKKRDEKLNKIHQENREHEAEMQRECEDAVGREQVRWERVCKLVDFNTKTNKSQRDVSRMRSLFLQLKAASLAGDSSTISQSSA